MHSYCDFKRHEKWHEAFVVEDKGAVLRVQVAWSDVHDVPRDSLDLAPRLSHAADWRVFKVADLIEVRTGDGSWHLAAVTKVDPALRKVCVMPHPALVVEPWLPFNR